MIIGLSFCLFLSAGAAAESCSLNEDFCRDVVPIHLNVSVNPVALPVDEYLKSSANLADVPDKQEALKNLGIIDNHCAPTYSQDIDFTGLDIKRFYPVWWTFSDKSGGCYINIFRYYSEDTPLNPFGDGDWHVAGLNLQIEGNDLPWGGGYQYLDIKRISQTYRKTVRLIGHGMASIARPVNGRPIYNNWNTGDVVSSSKGSGLYLRGGLMYHVTKDFPQPVGFSREEGEVEMDRSIQLDWGIQWDVKSYAEDDPFLGPDY